MSNNSSNTPQVTIFCDGGCNPNPGPGGYAAIFTTIIGGKQVEREIRGAVAEANNQRMELMATAEALEALKRPCTVELFSDSQYVVKGMTEWIQNWIQNGWQTSKRKPVKNADLWQRIHEQSQRHDVSFKWAKAQGDNLIKKRVEELVQEARAEFTGQQAEKEAPIEKAQTEAVQLQPESKAPSDKTRYRLMIAGSRRASANMLEYARRVVARAEEQGWEIVVGDNPQGVDAEVVRECNRRGLCATVYGITSEPRNGGAAAGRYAQMGKNYSERDRLMAKATDRALFIHDGKSRGTLKGYRYAKTLNRTAHLIDFGSTF